MIPTLSASFTSPLPMRLTSYDTGINFSTRDAMDGVVGLDRDDRVKLFTFHYPPFTFFLYLCPYGCMLHIR